MIKNYLYFHFWSALDDTATLAEEPLLTRILGKLYVIFFKYRIYSQEHMGDVDTKLVVWFVLTEISLTYTQSKANQSNTL